MRSGTKFEKCQTIPNCTGGLSWLTFVLKWITSSLIVNGVMCFDLAITHVVLKGSVENHQHIKCHKLCWLCLSRVFLARACARRITRQLSGSMFLYLLYFMYVPISCKWFCHNIHEERCMIRKLLNQSWPVLMFWFYPFVQMLCIYM